MSNGKWDWKDYQEIAVALNALYPNRSPVVMSRSELMEKVIALPNFGGRKNLSPDDTNLYLSFIANKWILVKDGGRTKTIDDSPFV